jgi:hypothetical protein
MPAAAIIIQFSSILYLFTCWTQQPRANYRVSTNTKQQEKQTQGLKQTNNNLRLPVMGAPPSSGGGSHRIVTTFGCVLGDPGTRCGFPGGHGGTVTVWRHMYLWCRRETEELKAGCFSHSFRKRETSTKGESYKRQRRSSLLFQCILFLSVRINKFSCEASCITRRRRFVRAICGSWC